MAKSAAYKIEYADEGDAAFQTVTLTFANGESHTVEISKLDPAIVAQAACHGLKQKFADAAAGAKGDVAESFESIMGVVERIEAGDWSKERESTGPRPTIVAEAVVRALTKLGKSFDEAAVRAMFTGKGSEKNRADIQKDPAVAREILALKTELAEARIAKMEAEGGASGLAALVS